MQIHTHKHTHNINKLKCVIQICKTFIFCPLLNRLIFKNAKKVQFINEKNETIFNLYVCNV